MISAVKPNLDSYVFLKVNEEVTGVMVEEETAESRFVYMFSFCYGL